MRGDVWRQVGALHLVVFRLTSMPWREAVMRHIVRCTRCGVLIRYLRNTAAGCFQHEGISLDCLHDSDYMRGVDKNGIREQMAPAPRFYRLNRLRFFSILAFHCQCVGSFGSLPAKPKPLLIRRNYEQLISHETLADRGAKTKIIPLG